MGGGAHQMPSWIVILNAVWALQALFKKLLAKRAVMPITF
jgi:hypothetical protein